MFQQISTGSKPLQKVFGPQTLACPPLNRSHDHSARLQVEHWVGPPQWVPRALIAFKPSPDLLPLAARQSAPLWAVGQWARAF